VVTPHNNLVVPCNAAPRPWLWPNLLSLDAPVVAVLWQALFARCFHASVNALAAALLVLAVWLIYAADRAFDAWSQNGGMPRHEFYRRHWRAVLPVWTAVLAIAGWLAWTRLPSLVFKEGLVLLAAVALYFAAVHLAPATLRGGWPKEAAVAVLFALGASLAAWNHLRSAEDALSILLFCCLCWINCAAIEHWESSATLERFVRGERSATSWPIGIAAICVGLAAIVLLHQHRPVLSGAEAASALGFVLLDRGRSRFTLDALRVLADVALLSPILFLPIAGIVV
jgi:hypothetical protein